MVLTVQTKNNNNKGFTLIEILLAFGVAVIVTVGMISLGISATRASVTNKAAGESAKVAQQEIERLKLLRDTAPGWEDFVSRVSACFASEEGYNPCHLEPSEAGTSYDVKPGAGTVNPSTAFKVDHSFWVSGPGGGKLLETDFYAKVSETASWQVGSSEKAFTIETALSNWRLQ